MIRRSIRPAFGFAAPVVRFLNRFRRREDGAIAIWFAVLALPLAILAFGLIDVNRAGVEKRHLQDALDAATLLAARSTSSTSAQMQTIGAAALAAELTGVTDATLTSSTFTISGTRIVGTASAKVTPVVANLWLGGDMVINATSEVVRSSKNLEVAMVLDITGSMEGTKITDLKTAAADMVDLVVQEAQTPFYTKVGIVPFSLGVNMGSYADAARGAVIGTRSITGAGWQSGADKAITGLSRANSKVTITSESHGLADGDVVYISGVVGTTQINGRTFTVANKQSNTFQLSGIDSGTVSAWTSGGKIQKCQISDCRVVVTTASNHGYANGDTIRIDGVQGMTSLNNTNFTIGNSATNTFSLAGTYGPNLPAYTSAGTSYCTKQGCEYYRFTNASGNTKQYQITSCVTERTDTSSRYTDVAASTTPVGRFYAGETCPASQIMPLSSDKTALKALITDFPATGTTAGQIGAAWGWYLVSPNFAYMWPTGSKPALYTATDTLKVVVFMTDGEFNTAYCKDVLSNDSTGNNSDQINCDASNGNGTAQAQSICTGMKNAGVVVYTVGFAIGGNATAKKFIEDCATSSKHVYLPSSGTALKDAFAAIGRDIMKLRIAK